MQEQAAGTQRTAPQVGHPLPSEEGTTYQGVEDFYLNAKARILPSQTGVNRSLLVALGCGKSLPQKNQSHLLI